MEQRTAKVNISSAGGTAPTICAAACYRAAGLGEKSDVPMLIRSCIVHYELEQIRPLADGNGCIGRLTYSSGIETLEILGCFASVNSSPPSKLGMATTALLS